MALANALDARGHAGRDTGALLAAVLLVGGSLNGLLVRVLEAWQLHGFDSPLLGVSSFEILATVVGARAILASDSTAGSFRSWPELAFGAAMLVPSSAASWFAVAAYALLGATRSQGEGRAGYLLFLALALCSIWSSVLLKWWAGPAAALDAHAVWGILSWFRSDLAVAGNVVGVPTGHNLIIMTACTSASLTPKALLGLAALNMLADGKVGRRLGAAAVAVAVLSVGINLLRLLLMASSADLYALIHGPVGANGFDALQTLAVVGLGLWAARA